MVKSGRFALAFRTGALLFALAGILKQVGVFDGTISFRSFMYYTTQSNILAAGLFALLAYHTAKSLRQGSHGSAGWHTRLVMICTVDLLVTLVVFWVLLAPLVPAEYIMTFENFAVHTVTPFLCLLDYVLFSEARRMKYRDIYYSCVFPIFYAIFALVAGLVGYVYYYTATHDSPFSGALTMVPVRFPYFFLDIDRNGIMVAVYTGAIMVFFLLLGHAIFFIDRKRRGSSLVQRIRNT